MVFVEVYGEPVCEQSFSEMVAFVRFANSIGEIPLLFGGWAVYHHNSYAGSRDVDFVVSDEKFGALVDFLVKNGYGQREARLFKDGIFFDLYKKSEDVGFGEGTLVFSRLYEGGQRVFLKKYGAMASREEVLLPSLAVLIFSKAIALHQRDVPKDRSDLMALLLKAEEKDLLEARSFLAGKSGALARLATLRNDGASLGFVVKPTKKALRSLNEKLKAMLR